MKAPTLTVETIRRVPVWVWIVVGVAVGVGCVVGGVELWKSLTAGVTVIGTGAGLRATRQAGRRRHEEERRQTERRAEEAEAIRDAQADRDTLAEVVDAFRERAKRRGR